jgi:hypothetical protein
MSTRLLLLLLVAVGVAVNPTLRSRLEPHVTPRVRPYLQRLLDPVHEWSARSRVEEVARRLQTRAAHGSGLPSGAAFSDFMRSEYRGPDAALDPWGVPLYLHRDALGYRVGSAGRDRVPFTADDVVSAPLPGSAR